jgi:3-methyladenine DNA glycosylase AlkD
MKYEEIIKNLKSLKNPKNVLGMARFGIRPKSEVLGVPVPEIRKIAKQIKKSMRSPASHKLALKLFDSKIHEARLLASMIADPEILTEKETDKWVKTFDSWDIVDQFCMNLFSKSEIAKNKILEFSNRKKEFEKRTAFALIASLAVHDKKMSDKDFIKYFLIIKKQSNDERNFVKKSVNWALRQIGKRNKNLNKKAIQLAREIKNINNKASKWIANNAITELTSEPVQNRLKIK